LAEEVSGVWSIAGAFAIGVAHDPLLANLVLGGVRVHVALQIQYSSIQSIEIVKKMNYLHDGDGG